MVNDAAADVGNGIIQPVVTFLSFTLLECIEDEFETNQDEEDRDTEYDGIEVQGNLFSVKIFHILGEIKYLIEQRTTTKYEEANSSNVLDRLSEYIIRAKRKRSCWCWLRHHHRNSVFMHVLPS